MTFTQLQLEVGEWSRRNFPNNQPHHPLLGAVEELGELSHAHLKMEQGIRGTYAEHQCAKLDAVGDIVVFLADYCERNEISLEHAVEVTWGGVKQRDWQKNKQDGTLIEAQMKGKV